MSICFLNMPLVFIFIFFCISATKVGSKQARLNRAQYFLACDECARDRLVESDHVCPLCHESDISPEDIIPNQYLRKKVAQIKGEVSL